jgi:hypothetical protein
MARSHAKAYPDMLERRPLMPDPQPAYASQTAGGIRCPRCHGAVVRIHRRTFDRLISVVSPRKRFRCPAFGCGWEGTLRAKH